MMMTSSLAIKITDAVVKLKLTEPNVVLCFLAFEFKVDFFLIEDEIKENEIALFSQSTNSSSGGREPLKGKFSVSGWKMHFGAKSHLANLILAYFFYCVLVH